MKNFFSFFLLGLLLTGPMIGCKTAPDTKITVPRPDHVIIVIYENHKYSQVVGSQNAPYISSLVKDAAVFTDSHGVTHPSQPNYLAFFAGDVQGVTDDKCLDAVSPFHTPNLGASLIKKGFSFKGYAQGLPEVGSKICNGLKSDLTQGHLYARKHCPWVNWQGTGDYNFPDSVSQPMTDFPIDYNNLPNLSFVIPDMDHDMHNIGNPGDSAAIQRGDSWLKENLSGYINWAKTHNSLLIFTFDEDDFTAENRIPTFFIGAHVKPGEYGQRITHFDVLRTLEKMYDLPQTMQDTSAHAITNIWQ